MRSKPSTCSWILFGIVLLFGVFSAGAFLAGQSRTKSERGTSGDPPPPETTFPGSRGDEARPSCGLERGPRNEEGPATKGVGPSAPTGGDDGPPSGEADDPQRRIRDFGDMDGPLPMSPPVDMGGMNPGVNPGTMFPQQGSAAVRSGGVGVVPEVVRSGGYNAPRFGVALPEPALPEVLPDPRRLGEGCWADPPSWDRSDEDVRIHPYLHEHGAMTVAPLLSRGTPAYCAEFVPSSPALRPLRLRHISALHPFPESLETLRERVEGGDMPNDEEPLFAGYAEAEQRSESGDMPKGPLFAGYTEARSGEEVHSVVPSGGGPPSVPLCADFGAPLPCADFDGVDDDRRSPPLVDPPLRRSFRPRQGGSTIIPLSTPLPPAGFEMHAPLRVSSRPSANFAVGVERDGNYANLERAFRGVRVSTVIPSAVLSGESESAGGHPGNPLLQCFPGSPSQQGGTPAPEPRSGGPPFIAGALNTGDHSPPIKLVLQASALGCLAIDPTFLQSEQLFQNNAATVFQYFAGGEVSLSKDQKRAVLAIMASLFQQKATVLKRMAEEIEGG